MSTNIGIVPWFLLKPDKPIMLEEARSRKKSLIVNGAVKDERCCGPD